MNGTATWCVTSITESTLPGVVPQYTFMSAARNSSRVSWSKRRNRALTVSDTPGPQGCRRTGRHILVTPVSWPCRSALLTGSVSVGSVIVSFAPSNQREPPSAFIPGTVSKNEPFTSVCQSMSFDVSVTAPTSVWPVNCAANGTGPSFWVLARFVSAGITALAGPNVI
ncbi:MAG: hypothetical protein DMD65_00350, partial [Gemmatimonadetes bacterium]